MCCCCYAFVFIKRASHRELTQHAMLSEMACLTPFSDFNQSPRNMYQCQVCVVSSDICHTGFTLYDMLNSCRSNCNVSIVTSAPIVSALVSRAGAGFITTLS